MSRALIVAALAVFSLLAALRAEPGPRPATPEEAQLLKEALKNSEQDTDRWAYTETTVIQGSKGLPRGETVVRFDPSQPYAEQYTPLKVKGRTPSDRDRKKYREKGEERGRKLEREAGGRVAPAAAGSPPRTGTRKAEIDLANPLVAREEPDRLVYQLPLKSNRKDFPADKFEVLVQVNRQARLVERAEARILEAFRMKLVAKVKAGEVKVDFGVVDPKYGPVITRVTGGFGASLMFVPINGTLINTRTDWKRVKPFDERFQVKIGPLQALDF